MARPDLAAPEQHVIFEIKSLDDTVDGLLKVNLYLGLLKYLDPMGSWSAGTADEYTPPETLLVDGYAVAVFPANGGVITYAIVPNIAQINSAIAAGAALSVAALVSVTSVVAGSTLGISALKWVGATSFGRYRPTDGWSDGPRAPS